MENFWPWLLGLVLLAVLVIILIPMIRRPAARKTVFTKPETKDEMAEEVTFIPEVSRHKNKEGEHDPFIPHLYGVDRLVLSVRDPNWLHVYWEITGENRERFIRQYGSEAWYTSRFVIRIYDVTGINDLKNVSLCSFREVNIESYADNWFIEVGQPDRSFYAELGLLLRDGKFITLLRSNRVTTPRAAVSDKIDEEWMWKEGIYHFIGRVSFGPSSAVLAERPIEAVSGIIPLGVSSPGFEKQ